MLKTEAAGFYKLILAEKAFLGDIVVKNPPANTGDHQRLRFDPCVRKFPWRRKWQPAPGFLPGKSHGQQSLVGYSPKCFKASGRSDILLAFKQIKSPTYNHGVLGLVPSLEEKSIKEFVHVCLGHTIQTFTCYKVQNISKSPQDTSSISWGYPFLVCSRDSLCCAVLCLVAESCQTLCDSMDCSPPGSSVHGDSPGKNTGVGCHASSRGSS